MTSCTIRQHPSYGILRYQLIRYCIKQKYLSCEFPNFDVVKSRVLFILCSDEAHSQLSIFPIFISSIYHLLSEVIERASSFQNSTQGVDIGYSQGQGSNGMITEGVLLLRNRQSRTVMPCRWF